jgi:hypothetical protein
MQSGHADTRKSSVAQSQRTAALDLNQLFDAAAVAEFPANVTAARAQVDGQRKLLLDIGEAVWQTAVMRTHCE